jgi:HEXXH motif-containing protein
MAPEHLAPKQSTGPGFCLTFPSDGAQTTRQVVTEFLKKIAKDYFTLPLGLYAPEIRPVAAAVSETLKGSGKKGVFNVLRRPQLHVFLNCLATALGDRDRGWARQLAEQLLVQLLFELAMDRRLPDDGILWPKSSPLDTLGSPTHLACFTPPSHTSLHFTNERIEAMDGENLVEAYERAPCDQYTELRQGVALSLTDSNPISDFEAHPDKEGNQLSLGDAEASQWAEMLAECVDTIEAHLPDLWREMSMVLQQLIPVGTDDEKHLSASYQEAVGTVYLTLHPNLMTMTEAVIHEYQHSKLNMLFHLEAVMYNAFHPLYTSPVRPDPRPLHGIMLAAHAFVPVAELYRRMEEAGAPMSMDGYFRERFEQIVGKNSDAISTLLENADPTPRGLAVIDELDRLNRSHREYLGLGDA